MVFLLRPCPTGAAVLSLLPHSCARHRKPAKRRLSLGKRLSRHRLGAAGSPELASLARG
ncbi:hypothetical protein AB395_0000636 [Sinorhizobium fredii CCBAU 45436]|nr:hypothetical protein SF83666_c06100 [Sinorhizobium fredii CCBAU 83666]AWI56314.1 hypothetical protein AB395_0000636 [Sinorhizobium fredii CCBAU 45436]AWM24108.1 hypothetical protein AOX55_0000831 [Sinorhizobium fredii CCBAU 25509]